MLTALRRVQQAALTTLVVLGACEITSAPDEPTADLLDVTSPGTVVDLSVTEPTDSSVTLSFTEVNDGLGSPAKYDVRYSVTPISWGSAPSVANGTCATPVAGTAIGARRYCTVLGLAAATSYDFQLVAYRGTLNAGAVFGGLSNVASGTTAGPAAGEPGTVGDLSVRAVTSNSVTLSFTEVTDGTGLPAQYDVRYSPALISWGSAKSVAEGTCATPVGGTALGAVRECTVLGLEPATRYDFQLVAFRGTLNAGAQFGGLSNIANATTPEASLPSTEPAFSTATGDVPIYQDDIDRYTTPHDMDSWPAPAIHPFYPDLYPNNYAVIAPARGGSGRALRLVYTRGNGERYIWKTHPEDVSTWYGPANAAFVLQYWFRISKNGAPGGGPGYGSTAVGMKWLQFWVVGGSSRTQFGVTAGNATTGPLWHVNANSQGPMGYQPVGPYWNQLNNNEWHRVTYLYQPNSAPGATDGVARMWIDGRKIVDVSAAAAGVTPEGGSKVWCTLSEVAKLDTRQIGTINLGEYMNGGLGDGVTDLPMTLDFDDVLWWKLPARVR